MTEESSRLVMQFALKKVSNAELAQIRSIGPRAERAVQEAVFKVGQRARDNARRFCPKKSGALAASIYVTKGTIDKSPDATKHTPGGAFTKQSTRGYFSAINAAARKSKNSAGIPRLYLEPNVEFGRTSPQTISDIGGSVFSYTKSGKNRSFFGEQVARTYKLPGYKLANTNNEDDFEDDENLQYPFLDSMAVGGANSFFVTIGAAAFYAGFVEFGHTVHNGKYSVPKPFMRPAMDIASAELGDAIIKAMRSAMQGRG